MVFAEYEVPVAQSMIKMAIQLQKATAHPIEEFLCYWAAFNNIYVTIAERAGRTPQLRKNPDGSIRTRTVGGVEVPQVDVVGERDQIDLDFQQFAGDLKRRLVEHPSTVFFAHRTPHWSGLPIERDGRGQRLNGVLNVGYTTDSKHLVWSPIDVTLFEAYQKELRDDSTRDSLARLILDILYTVRSNTFHGGKRADDANDREVLQHAVPLLKMIVGSFVH